MGHVAFRGLGAKVSCRQAFIIFALLIGLMALIAAPSLQADIRGGDVYRNPKELIRKPVDVMPFVSFFPTILSGRCDRQPTWPLTSAVASEDSAGLIVDLHAPQGFSSERAYPPLPFKGRQK